MTHSGSALHAEGMVNLRDLGGLPVAGGCIRAGRLFRSAHPGELTAEGALALQAAGIHTLCDLRSEEERALRPLSQPWPGTVLHLPVAPRVRGRLEALAGDAPSPEDDPDLLMCEAYRTFVDEHAATFGKVIANVAESAKGQAVLIHCTAGKDRTGLAIALVLGLLGANRATIEADYMETNRHWRGTGRLDRSPPGVRAAMTEARLHYLGTAFDRIADRHGDLQSFAHEAMRLDAQRLRRLRQALVE